MWGFFRKPKSRKVGVFVDVGTFVNGDDNRNRRLDWKRAIRTVESIIDFGKEHLFLAFPNISNPTEMEAYKKLEYLGAKLGSNSAIKNDSDLCLSYELQRFVEENEGNVDLVLLAGDRDYVKTIESLTAKYKLCKLHVFCLGRSTSMVLENLAKSTGGKVYKELDVFYETTVRTVETHHGDVKENSKDKETSLELLILQSISQAEEKGRYAFFQKTAELVSLSNNVEIQSVKEKLSSLISEGYLKQENRTSSKNNPIRTIEFTPAGYKLLREFATQ